MFSSKQFSRNYRQKHKQNKFSTLQFVLVPTTISTSCVRFDFQRSYFSQYRFYEHASYTRQWLSHAPILKLRHSNDLTHLTDLTQAKNLTQLLINLLRPNDNNKKIDSNDNNDSNSSSISSLSYSIVKRVFQIDGECIVI